MPYKVFHMYLQVRKKSITKPQVLITGLTNSAGAWLRSYCIWNRSLFPHCLHGQDLPPRKEAGITPPCPSLLCSSPMLPFI